MQSPIVRDVEETWGDALSGNGIARGASAVKLSLNTAFAVPVENSTALNGPEMNGLGELIQLAPAGLDDTLAEAKVDGAGADIERGPHDPLQTYLREIWNLPRMSHD